ncbi:MAG TPA: CapA family protein [Micromonosporaceae bacterium]
MPISCSPGWRRAALAIGLAASLLAGGCTSAPTAEPAPATAPTRPSPSPSATPAGTAPKPETITIVGSGDILLHPPLWEQARRDARAAGGNGFDFDPLLAEVKDIVSGADLAICHLETPLAAPGGPFVGYPRFSVPPQIATALADNGYDTCSTASNHTIDQGEAGVRRTLDALDAAGIRHAGSYRSKADHDRVNLIEVHGVKIASLAYTFGFNGLLRPAGKAWIANQIDPATILDEAKRARAAGAEIVVVSLHFGTEYRHSPNDQQRTVARTLLASPDIDLILGHHAHVVQPFERIGDKWVAYGMGNKVAHHGEPRNDNREGVLSRFTFTEMSPGRWRVTTAEAIPVWMDLRPDRLVNIAAELADPTTPSGERATLRATWNRIKGYLISRGAGQDGLRISGSN